MSVVGKLLLDKLVVDIVLVHTQLTGSMEAGRKVHSHGSKDPGKRISDCDSIIFLGTIICFHF